MGASFSITGNENTNENKSCYIQPKIQSIKGPQNSQENGNVLLEFSPNNWADTDWNINKNNKIYYVLEFDKNFKEKCPGSNVVINARCSSSDQALDGSQPPDPAIDGLPPPPDPTLDGLPPPPDPTLDGLPPDPALDGLPPPPEESVEDGAGEAEEGDGAEEAAEGDDTGDGAGEAAEGDDAGDGVEEDGEGDDVEGDAGEAAEGEAAEGEDSVTEPFQNLDDNRFIVIIILLLLFLFLCKK